MSSYQITVRNVDAELSRRLKAVSAERGESLNSTVLHFLRAAVGLDLRRQRLRRYANWTSADLKEFKEALDRQRVVDERSWQ